MTDILESAKEQLHNNNFSIEQSDNDMIVCLSDLHLGATYYNFDGYYDSNIAKERLNQYLAEIIEIQKTHNAENCVVLLLGDLISGNIHSTISVTNKENVIEQVKLACEYISDFVYELGKHFNNVELRGVSGNHSRIQEKKENALLGERLDSLIVWFIKSMLKNARYYDFVDAENEEDFNSYVGKCKELALYDTGVTAEYGDRLITLSTCEYSAQNGRLVVVAKKVG